MSQDNDSISFDDEPIELEDLDDKPISIEGADDKPLSVEPDDEPLTIAEESSGRAISHTAGIRGAGAEGFNNEWLDSDDIDVKEVGHLIGTMHGKIDEDNIIVMVWY